MSRRLGPFWSSIENLGRQFERSLECFDFLEIVGRKSTCLARTAGVRCPNMLWLGIFSQTFVHDVPQDSA